MDAKGAEAAVIAALTGARGRGKTGLSEDQLAELNEAIETLEADSGVSGVHIAQQRRRLSCE